MPVAPSFQSLVPLGTPYLKGDKYYLQVQNPKTGSKREVRYYDDYEYSKTYGFPNGRPWWNQRPDKDCLGFSKGYIYLVEDKIIAEARYTGWWGWYVPSESEARIPENAIKYKLLWEEVGDENGFLRRPVNVEAIKRARATKEG